MNVPVKKPVQSSVALTQGCTEYNILYYERQCVTMRYTMDVELVSFEIYMAKCLSFHLLYEQTVQRRYSLSFCPHLFST